jgi:hypothetical protein
MHIHFIFIVNFNMFCFAIIFYEIYPLQRNKIIILILMFANVTLRQTQSDAHIMTKSLVSLTLLNNI